MATDDQDAEESELVRYARSELHRAGFLGTADALDAKVGSCTLLLLKCLSMYGSGNPMEHSATIELFKRLASFRPLTPIEDVPDEWEDISGDDDRVLYQHKRCSSVFKTPTGGAFNTEGLVLVYPDGTRAFHVTKSVLPISFPYIVREPIATHVDKDGNFYH